MNLYLISQTVNNDWDTYDAAVVAALSEEDAKTIEPWEGEEEYSYRGICSWTNAVNVKAKLLCKNYKGKRGVILASFNAG